MSSVHLNLIILRNAVAFCKTFRQSYSAHQNFCNTRLTDATHNRVYTRFCNRLLQMSSNNMHTKNQTNNQPIIMSLEKCSKKHTARQLNVFTKNRQAKAERARGVCLRNVYAPPIKRPNIAHRCTNYIHTERPTPITLVAIIISH